MRYVFILHKDEPLLARSEVKALYGDPFRTYENMLFIDTGYDDFSRLAYTKKVLELLDDPDWTEVIDGSYKVVGDAKLAEHIWESLEDPKVDVKNPQIKIVSAGDIVGKECRRDNPDFNSRRAHLRPGHYPASLHPKLARAMVNLTGLRSGKILDPFCGTGGILIEANLIGFETYGHDISEKILDLCRQNIEYFGLDAHLEQRDARALSGEFDAIVTELPFGRNTKVDGDIEELFIRFLESAKQVTDRMVVSFPEVDIDLCGWKVKEEFKIVLHKSLSKKILSLVKDI